jgi:DNA-binding transcriptional ArsR family regulator
MLNQCLPTDDSRLDRVFSALADPNRRRILERLSRGPASVSELARPLGISLPGVVQHLQALQASGLIKSHKAGRVRTCELEPTEFEPAAAWIAQQRAMWNDRFDRLEAYLQEMDDE